MIFEQRPLRVATGGRAIVDITAEVAREVRASKVDRGLCHLFIHHTSASLIVTENADPDVHRDLETWLARQVVDGDPAFRHDQEGADDMAAHIRSVLTQTELTVPVRDRRLALGTWQGLYLWEHRYRGHKRELTLTISGMSSG